MAKLANYFTQLTSQSVILSRQRQCLVPLTRIGISVLVP